MSISQRESQQEQHQFISELLHRQEDVLSQIDQLNGRIERLIGEISQDRRSESKRQAQVAKNRQGIESDDADRREAA